MSDNVSVQHPDPINAAHNGGAQQCPDHKVEQAHMHANTCKHWAGWTSLCPACDTRSLHCTDALLDITEASVGWRIGRRAKCVSVLCAHIVRACILETISGQLSNFLSVQLLQAPTS